MKARRRNVSVEPQRRHVRSKEEPPTVESSPAVHPQRQEEPLVPKAVIEATFGSMHTFLAGLKKHYEEETTLLTRRLDELDRQITALERP
jgi:hypothetical protein